jgi:hypothetical protein
MRLSNQLMLSRKSDVSSNIMCAASASTHCRERDLSGQRPRCADPDRLVRRALLAATNVAAVDGPELDQPFAISGARQCPAISGSQPTACMPVGRPNSSAAGSWNYSATRNCVICVPIAFNVVMIWPDVVRSKYLLGSDAHACKTVEFPCVPLRST